MEELIKRLERVIQTGTPDKDGMHPISAETVLEVVKGLSEHGTNLAEVGTSCSEFPNTSDCISRQAAIEAMAELQGRASTKAELKGISKAWKRIKQLQPIQPKRGRWEMGMDERFVECSECGLMTTRNELRGLAVFGKNEPNFCPNCGADMSQKGENSESN